MAFLIDGNYIEMGPLIGYYCAVSTHPGYSDNMIEVSIGFRPTTVFSCRVCNSYTMKNIINNNVTSYCANQYPNGNVCGAYYYKKNP